LDSINTDKQINSSLQDIDIEDDGGTDPKEARVFDTVIQGLEREYPADKLSEISTSFCFICLLHLANERGLKIESGEKQLDVEEMDERGVSSIWNLQVSHTHS
jgi:condensin complex subunit 2